MTALVSLDADERSRLPTRDRKHAPAYIWKAGRQRSLSREPVDIYISSKARFGIFRGKSDIRSTPRSRPSKKQIRFGQAFLHALSLSSLLSLSLSFSLSISLSLSLSRASLHRSEVYGKRLILVLSSIKLVSLMNWRSSPCIRSCEVKLICNYSHFEYFFIIYYALTPYLDYNIYVHWN